MAELGQLSYSIILDDKKFTKQAQGIVKKLKDVDSQINDLMSSDSTRLSKPFDLAGMSIEKMVTQAKVLEAAFKGLSQSGTGVLSQDAINLKLRWQEIQAEVAKYGLNLKSSLMEQQKIVEPLKNLQQVLAMPTNSLDEVAAKLSEVKRIRAEQIQTDASYISNMSVLNKVEGELIAQQKSAIFIGKEALTVEQQLTSELQKRPISINDIIASAKNLEVLYKSLDDKESALGVEAQQRWLGMRNQLQSYGYVIKSSVMEQQTLNGALAMQENTVGQIELKMRALSSVRKNINVTEKESIETLKKVNDEYMRLSDQLKKVGARQYNLADLARNTNGAFSPLGFSIQQVARELPSLTMGAQMFFLAISNNLPILSDELRKAKESYKALVAEGKTAVPVWKQVISSIFSWQTAMVVGITLLTMYGREIGNWIKGLFSAKKANDDLTKATLELNGELSKEATALNLLFNKLKDTERGTTERRKAVENLNSKYGEYIKNLNLEKASLDDIYIAQQQVNSELRKNISLKKIDSMRSENDKKFDEETKDYYETLLNNFRGRDQGVVSAILDQMVADSKRLNIGINKDLFFEKISQAGVNVGDSYKDVYKNLIYINKELSKWELSNINIENVSEGISSVYKNQIEEQKDLIKEAETALKLAQSMPTSDESQIVARNKAIKSAQDELNRLNKLGIPDKPTKTPSIDSKQDKFESDQIRAYEDLQTKIRQAEIDADEDGFEKRMKQMKLNHEIELREIERHREDLLREVVDNQSKLFEANPKNKGKKFDASGITLPKEITDQYDKFIKKTKDVQEKELSDELKSLLDKYKDFYTKRSEIDKKYGSDLSILEGLAPSEDNNAKIKELKQQWRDEIKGLSADVDKLLSEEVPTGAGLAFRVSRVLSDVRNNISEKNKEILDAMVAATDEQKSELENLSKIWESAFREEGAQKLDAVAQTYFNDLLKKQKLDIDMGSISSATIDQLNRLRDALKSIKEELSGGGLVDLFESAGLSIENFKQYIDTSNLSATKDSLIKLTTYTPDEVKLTDEQRRSLEAIARILGVINSNQQKGLLDINIAKLNKAKAIADQLVSSFSEIGSALGELADATGNEGLRSLAEDMQFAAQMAQGVGDIVVGIISKNPQDIIKGVTSIATTLIKAEAQYQKARIEFLNSQRELQIEYNKLLIEQIRLQKEGANGVLYEDMLNNFRSAYDSAQSAIKKMDELYKSRQLKLVNNSSIGSSILSNLIPKYRPTENIQDYLSSISVQTGVKRKKFLGITTGSKAIYGDLLTAFPELIDKAGNLNLEYAKIVLSQNKFKDNGKLALEELIAYTEQYEESMKSLDDQLSSMFGDIGNLLSESLINAFHNGKLSADEFLSYVNKGIGDMVDNLVTNMVISSVFGDMLNEYKDKIKESLLSDDPQKNLTQLMGQMVGDIASGTEAVGNMMSLYASEKNRAGLGGVGSSDRTGLSGSLARASQESIDELTGVMYAGLEKLSLTSNGINAINITTTAMSAELKAQTMLLRSIDSYSSNLPYMRTGIESMVNQGIRIKP